MAATQLTGKQIRDSSIQRADVDTTTSGSALIAKLIAGANVSISSTGIDAGTGDVTLNLKSYLSNVYTALGGIDLGMSGLYDRNELTNAYYKGSVTVSITGPGTATAVSSLTNANSDFASITGTTSSTTQIRITVDTGSSQANYGRGLWQPFLQYRIPPDATGLGQTYYNTVSCEYSADNSTWYGADTATWPSDSWITTNFYTAQVPGTGLWMGKEAGNSIVNYRYVRFTLTNRVENAANTYKDQVWITQVGFRHVSAPYARQFVRSDGDTMYGALNVKSVISASNDLVGFASMSHNGSGGEGLLSTSTGAMAISPASGLTYAFTAGINGTFSIYGGTGYPRFMSISHNDTDSVINSNYGSLKITTATNKVLIPGVGSTVRVAGIGVSGDLYEATTALLGNSKRLSYGDVLLSKNLIGVDGADTYKTTATYTGAGYSGIEQAYGGNINFYALDGNTTANATVTPARRMSIYGPSGIVNIANLAGTGTRLTAASLSGDLSAVSIASYDGTALTVAGNTNAPTFKVGTLEFQNYSLSNSWLGDNIYFDGTNLKYRQTGAGGLLYFQGTETQIRQYASGTGGATVTAGQINAKFIAGGVVALGGNISTTVGATTGASLIANSSSVTIPSLAGSGVQMVITDNSGNISKQAIPSSSSLSVSTKVASYTLVLGDPNTDIQMNVASANTVTFPPNSSVAMPVGSQGVITQIGAGQTTLVQGSGVTINVPTGYSLALRAQNSSITWEKTGTDTWFVAGDLASSGTQTVTTPSYGDNSTQIASTAYVNNLMKVAALTSDAASNSTTTLAGITGLDQTVGAGTYHFKYIIRYQSAAATTGVKFSVTHTGTVTSFMYQLTYVDASATASTGAPTQNQNSAIAATTLGAWSARAKATTLGPSASVDTLNADMMMIIEGLMIVTVSGTLQLSHASEVAAASTIKAGTSLILTRTA